MRLRRGAVLKAPGRDPGAIGLLFGLGAHVGMSKAAFEVPFEAAKGFA